MKQLRDINNRSAVNRARNNQREKEIETSNNIKIIVSILAIVVIVMLTIIVVFHKVKSNKKNTIMNSEEIGKYEYFLLDSHEKVGVIDKTRSKQRLVLLVKSFFLLLKMISII